MAFPVFLNSQNAFYTTCRYLKTFLFPDKSFSLYKSDSFKYSMLVLSIHYYRCFHRNPSSTLIITKREKIC